MRPPAHALGSLLAIAMLAAQAGCTSSPATAAGVDPPAALLFDSGVGQVGSVGTVLGQPIVVLVTDSAGKVLKSVPVTWVVRGAGGSLYAAMPQTDGNGLASARWTLGAAVGADTVDVSIAGGLSLSFIATVVP